MNRQETYQIVRDHLLTQNKRSSTKKDLCLYRGPNDTSCAIGCLIPNNLYKKSMEGRSLMDVLEHEPKLSAFLEVDENMGDKGFLTGLQSIHDWHPLETWPQRLFDFANKYSLQP